MPPSSSNVAPGIKFVPPTVEPRAWLLRTRRTPPDTVTGPLKVLAADRMSGSAPVFSRPPEPAIVPVNSKLLSVEIAVRHSLHHSVTRPPQTLWPPLLPREKCGTRNGGLSGKG